MKCRHLAAAVLALSFSLTLLPACRRDKGSATPQAAMELAELRMEQELNFAEDADDELQAEILSLLSRFDETADARLTSTPHRITLLHLACVYKKAELARCLLLDGANPNARQLTEEPSADMGGGDTGAAVGLRPAFTPLSWATIPHREGATAEEMLPLINILVENGADVNQPGPSGVPPLATATIPSPAGEAVFLRLLELGARCSEITPPEALGKAIPLSALVAANGWHRALEKLLDNGGSIATPARSALHAAAEHPEQPGVLDCAKLLLSRGAEVDALNDEGATPLYIAAHSLAEPVVQEAAARGGAAGSAVLESYAAMLALLLEHGADPLHCCDADPEFPGSCAADFIAMRPEVRDLLAARGIEVPRRPIDFEAGGAKFLAEICRAAIFNTPAEEIAPYCSKIAALLATPTPEEQNSTLYADAFGHAVTLLARADAATAAGIIAQLPIWHEQHAWVEGDARTGALMLGLLSSRNLILPRAALLEHARHMDSRGVSEVAALLAELLERDPAAEADIEALCTDTSLPIRAGALTARLLRAGLPAPRNGAVKEWMLMHNIEEEAAPAALKRALLLTSLDKFWYGNMEAKEVNDLLEAMRSIGAPKAAAFYAELAPNLDKPEELDRLTAPGGAADEARYELECATALLLWSQREELRKLLPAAPTEPAKAQQD